MTKDNRVLAEWIVNKVQDADECLFYEEKVTLVEYKLLSRQKEYEEEISKLKADLAIAIGTKEHYRKAMEARIAELEEEVAHEKRRADDLHGRRIYELEEEAKKREEELKVAVEALTKVSNGYWHDEKTCTHKHCEYNCHALGWNEASTHFSTWAKEALEKIV